MGAPASSLALGALTGAVVIGSGGTAIPALMAAGLAMSAVSQVQQGMAAKEQADYQAAVAEQNALRAEDAAATARARGEISEQQHRLRVRQAVGTATAASAARGVLVNEGSALDLNANLLQTGDLDARMIGYNEELNALGLGDQAAQFRSDAQMTRRAGSNQRTAGFIGAASSLVSGSSLVSEKWYQFGGNPVGAPASGGGG